MTAKRIPKIVALSHEEQSPASALFSAVLNESLEKLLSEVLIKNDSTDFEELLQQSLPLVKTIPSEQNGKTLVVYMVNRYRRNAFKFFFEMFSRWLVPGKRLDVSMLYATDFKFPEISEDLYTLCEMTLTVEDPEDFAVIQCNLPLVEMETRLGLESAYYARRILEVKGLNADAKTSAIQEYMVGLVQKAPKIFGRDIFVEMQQMLVSCSEEYKAVRSPRHLCRMIGTQYYFRRSLLESLKSSPQQRHLLIKTFPAQLEGCNPEDKNRVLSVFVGVNFLKDKEVFEEQHLLTAIQNYLPSVLAIKSSFISSRRAGENVTTVYLEIEHEDKRAFTMQERLLLKEELVGDLKDRIGQLTLPVFMPRNEEEIMRNVLALSSQVRYVRDIPQVFISFDQQIDTHLHFLVIMVRVLTPGTLSIQELFFNARSPMEYLHERCKMVGIVRKRYAKEATIFRLKFSSKAFIRQDNTIDLYKARQEVVEELTRVTGAVRDFNGGMISKQYELLSAVRKLLIDENVKYNELLLENFFYSLTPVVMRTVSEPEAVKTLFTMLLQVVRQGYFNDDDSSFEVEIEGEYVYAIVATKDSAAKLALTRSLDKVSRHSSSLASAHLQVYGVPCLGYIYRSDDAQDQELFVQALKGAIEDWNVQHEQHLIAPA